MAPGKVTAGVVGQITRGTTNTNRLRRVDRWIARHPVLRRTPDPLVIDLGYGASGVTAFELEARLRRTRPDIPRPYRAFGYPLVPALYIAGAATILLVLFAYRASTTWPGLVIVLLGVPVYVAWRKPAASVR